MILLPKSGARHSSAGIPSTEKLLRRNATPFATLLFYRHFSIVSWYSHTMNLGGLIRLFNSGVLFWGGLIAWYMCPLDFGLFGFR